MLNIKKDIESYMAGKEDPVKLKSIMRTLGFGLDDRQYLKSVLKEMVREGSLVKTGVHYWAPDGKKQAKEIKQAKSRQREVVVGRLTVTARGMGFVEATRGQDWMIPRVALNGGRHGDMVKARRTGRDHNLRILAEVIEIDTFGTSVVLGVFEVDGFHVEFMPFNGARLYRKEMFGFPADVKDGQIARWDRAEDGAWHFGEILGHIDDPLVDEKVVLAEFGIVDGFPEQVLQAAERFREERDFDLGTRTDFRDEMVFTVDGATARDFDDALHVKQINQDEFEVGIHIADVSSFVEEDDPLDLYAAERGNSVYLPHKAIPMLPTVLSTGLCSLNPNVERYTLSVLVRLNGNGKLISFSLHKGLIRSSYRLTYGQVALACIDRDDETRKQLEGVVPSLDLIMALSGNLNKRRRKAGSLALDLPEVVIRLDENQEMAEVRQTHQTDANRMIEAFMCLANECVASHMYEAGIGIPFRIHEPPSAKRLEELSLFLTGLGIEASEEMLSEPAAALNDVLDKLRKKPGARVLQTQVLKSLKLAEYHPENRGHFGLASTHYAHFTSPIRRYADLIIHRRLSRLLDHPELGPEHFDDSGLAQRCAHISEMERQAARAEKSFRRIKILRHIKKHELGGEFDGIVEDVKNFGVFVGIEELQASGLIHVEAFEDDYYEFNPESLTLVGKRNGRVLRIGDSIRVQIVMVDFIARRLELGMVKGKQLPGSSKQIKQSRGPKRTLSSPKGRKKGRARRRGR